MTHCKNGHELTGDNVYVWKHGKTRGLLRQCKICARERGKKKDYSGNLSEATVRRVIEAVESGATLTALSGNSRNGKVPFVVNVTRLSIFRKNTPKFDRWITPRLLKNAEANRVALAQERRKTVPTILLVKSHDIMDVIRAGIPQHWDREKQNDVLGRVWLELSEGRVKRHQIPDAIKQASIAHNRMFSEWAMGGGAGKWRSLDAPAFADGTMTVGETVSNGLWSS